MCKKIKKTIKIVKSSFAEFLIRVNIHLCVTLQFLPAILNFLVSRQFLSSFINFFSQSCSIDEFISKSSIPDLITHQNSSIRRSYILQQGQVFRIQLTFKAFDKLINDADPVYPLGAVRQYFPKNTTAQARQKKHYCYRRAREKSTLKHHLYTSTDKIIFVPRTLYSNAV